MIAIEACIPRLLDIRASDSSGGRVGLDPAGTRTVHRSLLFAPRLCEDVLMSITEKLSLDELELIAMLSMTSLALCLLESTNESDRLSVRSFAFALRTRLERRDEAVLLLSVVMRFCNQHSCR